MKTFTGICRVLVGTVFVLSGLIKANDPYGFTFKLEEYFEVFIHDLSTKKIPAPVDSNSLSDAQKLCPEKFKAQQQFLDEEVAASDRGFIKNSLVSVFNFFKKEQNALFLAVIICVLEIALGICIITGYSIRVSSWLLLAMLIFFAFLTFYSAYYKKVTDCGCFGDALKLTPWESFYKDMILLILALPIFIWQKKIKGTPFNMHEKVISIASVAVMILLCALQFHWWFPVIFLVILLAIRWIMASVSRPAVSQIVVVTGVALLSSVFAVYCINHLSVKDYRGWKPGANIRENLKSQPEQSEIVLVYLNKNNCSEVSIPMNQDDPSYKLLMDSTFQADHAFWKQDKKVIKAGMEPKIKDFTLDDPNTGLSHRDTVVGNTGFTFLFVLLDVEGLKLSGIEKINEIAEYAENNGMIFVGATASSSDKVEAFRFEHQAAYPIYLNDKTALKTILRPGPGLVLIKDGIVLNKWQYRDIPSLEKLKKKYLDQ